MEIQQQKTKTDIMIRYATRLVTHDIAKMAPNSQNLMSLLFAIWTKSPNAETIIDLDELKTQLKIEHQSEDFVSKIIAKTSKEIINKSFVDEKTSDGGFVIGYMIYQFSYNPDRKLLEVRTSPDFMELFTNLDNHYVTYNFSVFLNIKSKQAKNLYRLFCRNFKGQFTLDWEEFKKWLGYKETSENRNIVYALKKAIKYLLERDYLKECEMSLIFNNGTRKISKVHFSYSLSELPKCPKKYSESPKNDETPPSNIETPTYTKQDETPLFNETAAPETPPIDFSKITAVPPKNIKLPDISDLHLPPQKKEEKQPKPLIHHCIYCGKEMVIRKNGKTGAYFFACPERGHQTITMTTEEYRQYMENKNSV